MMSLLVLRRLFCFVLFCVAPRGTEQFQPAWQVEGKKKKKTKAQLKRVRGFVVAVVVVVGVVVVDDDIFDVWFHVAVVFVVVVGMVMVMMMMMIMVIKLWRNGVLVPRLSPRERKPSTLPCLEYVWCVLCLVLLLFISLA